MFMDHFDSGKSKIYQDAFVLVLSEYIDIVPLVLSIMGRSSFAKLMVVSFIARRSRLQTVELYSGHDKNDLLLKALMQIDITIDDLTNETPMFAAAVDLLIRSRKIQVDGDTIKAGRGIEGSTRFSRFIDGFIKECSSLSDEYILEEVLKNV